MSSDLHASKKHCFIIMPFSKTKKNHTKAYWDNHFDNFLKPLVESCSEIEAHRSVPLRQDILRQIINDLVFSDIVVADLTDSNPNVYWELGVRISFRHGTVTIANVGSEIPFDLKTKGLLFYDSDPEQRSDFAEKFRLAINDCLSNPNRPDSIVLETITGRGSIYSVIHHQEEINRLDGLIAENKMNVMIIDLAVEHAFKSSRRRFDSLRTSYGLVVTQLGNSALSLLLAEHYIEETPKFYEAAHNLMIYINTINARLNAWTTSKEVGKWFLDDTQEIRQFFLAFQKILLETKENMLSKC